MTFAPATLFFRSASQTRFESIMPSGEPACLDIDATISGIHERTSTVTKNPIESGANKSDHVINDNEVFSIEGVISDTPLSIITPVRNILTTANEELQILTTIAGSIGGLLQNRDDKAINAFKYLDELWRNHIPFKIISEFKTYDPVVFTSLSMPRTLQNGEAIRFTATIEQMEIATTLTAPKPSPEIVHTASQKEDLGKKDTQPITETVEKKSSFLFRLFRLGGPTGTAGQ